MIIKSCKNSIDEKLSRNSDVLSFEHAYCTIYLIPNFLTRRECADAIEIIKKSNSQSAIGGVHGNIIDISRSSNSHYFNEACPLSFYINNRISTTLGTNVKNHETLQGTIYHKNDYFTEHHDFIPSPAAQWERETKIGGQRIYSIILYLNDDFEGGQTHFPLLNATITPKEGMLVAWSNVNKSGECELSTLHASLPVKTGIKMILTSWIRETAYISV